MAATSAAAESLTIGRATSSDADDRPVERATVSPYSHPYDTDQAVILSSTHHMNTFGTGCFILLVLLFLSFRDPGRLSFDSLAKSENGRDT
jgi:hypothetical protein